MAKRRLEDERFALVRRGVDRLPRPARRGLPRLRGRRRAARRAARRRRGAVRRSSAARSPGSSRRRSTCRSGSANHVDHQLCREVGVGLLAEGRRWVMPGPEYAGIVDVLRGLPVRLVERLQPARGPARGRLRRACRPTSRSRPSTPTSPTSSSARSPASRSTRARSSRLFGGTDEMARQVRAYGTQGRPPRRWRRGGGTLLGDTAGLIR